MTGDSLGDSDLTIKTVSEAEDQLPENDEVPDLPSYRARVNRLQQSRGTSHQTSQCTVRLSHFARVLSAGTAE